MSGGAIAVPRGCGTRERGGIYLELGLSPKGKPMEWFIVDPPEPLPAGLVVNPLGMTTYTDPNTGVTHLIDWVGVAGYPQPCDTLEEVSRFGSSRRISRGFDFRAITAQTRRLEVHPRGIIRNFVDYLINPNVRLRTWCPKDTEGAGSKLPGHPLNVTSAPVVGLPVGAPRHCAGLWWQDINPEREGLKPVHDAIDRAVRVPMPAFTYTAYTRPRDIAPQYEPGFIASFPIGRIVVIDDPDRKYVVEEAFDAASRAGVPVEVVPE